MAGSARGSAVLAFLVLAAAFAGCLGTEDPADEGDGPAGEESSASPPIPVPAEVTGLSHLDHVEEEQGFDVAAQGTTAYVAARSGFYTVDVSDPAEAETLATVREAGSRYVELMPQDDRLIAVASGANQEVLHFLDVTDAQQPELLSSFDPDRTVHNVAIVPGTSLLYNPRGVGDAVDAGIDLIDASDPTDPEVVDRWSFPPTAGGQPIQTAGCGTVTFQLADDRAFCPAVTQTYVLDIADRHEPEVVSVISNPAINVHHWTQQMHDGDVLLIADWAAAGNTPTCEGTEPIDQGPPPGAVWAYDIADPADPQPRGVVAGDPPANVGPDEPCSPHVVEKVPGHEKALVGWHRAGVVLLDAAEDGSLSVLDRWVEDNNAWSVHVHEGLVLAPDRDAGLDVLALTG